MPMRAMKAPFQTAYVPTPSWMTAMAIPPAHTTAPAVINFLERGLSGIVDSEAGRGPGARSEKRSRRSNDSLHK